MAQQRGVANVRMRPTKATWRGALALGYRLNRPLESNLFMIMGIRTIPGAAMPILDKVTIDIPVLAAVTLSPTLTPSSVSSIIPCWSSILLISGILTVLAAATAQNGTSLPTNGGRFFVKEFNPRAAVRAAVVAAQ